MQFKAFEQGIEVNGTTVHSIVDGFGSFKSLAKRHLGGVGIGTEIDGEFQIDREAWYSQESWLASFEKIAKEIGDSTLKKIGQQIPENAIFPAWINDIISAVKSIDVAYHLNHRKDGKVMFNELTGVMTEGIGHYGCELIENKSMLICECKNPYPCAFDFGIISAMAKKFEITANVMHDNSKPCRKNGAESCTYIVTWAKSHP